MTPEERAALTALDTSSDPYREEMARQVAEQAKVEAEAETAAKVGETPSSAPAPVHPEDPQGAAIRAAVASGNDAELSRLTNGATSIFDEEDEE